ncbi:MAG TPA: hypothetical protein VF331_06245 [Polyangiales bacterium]
MTDVAINNTSNETRKARFREAYERALPDMAALPENELVIINLDIPSAVATTLGAWQEIAPLREQVMGLHDFDVTRFDKLETYALAAWQAHSMYVAASTPVAQIQELGDKAAASREQLLSDAVALAKRGLIDGERLKELKGPIGYKNVAVDIGVLVTLLRERWAVVSSKTALSSDELDAAETLADELITAVGQREQAPLVVAAATDNRQRAFSLLVKTYDQARRAVSYLRWNKDDIDSIAPSLYAGRQNTNHRKGADASQGEPPTSTTMVPHTPPAAVPTTAVGAAAAAPAVAQVPAGFPGSDPFGK